MTVHPNTRPVRRTRIALAALAAVAATLATILITPGVGQPVHTTLTARLAPSTHVTVSAHRCGAGQWPQDSLDACRRAIAAGYDEIEADAWISTDNIAVIYHDATIDPERCTGQPGRLIRDLTAEQITAVRCDGQPIPTARQLLDLVADSSVTLRLEVKMYHGQPVDEARSWARQVANMVVLTGLGGRVVMQDFAWAAIPAMHRVDPALRVSALISRRPTGPDVARAARLGAYDLSYDARWSTAQLDRSIVRAGLMPVVWNVDAVPEHPGRPDAATRAAVRAAYGRVVADGARVVITNYPDALC